MFTRPQSSPGAQFQELLSIGASLVLELHYMGEKETTAQVFGFFPTLRR
jgi:hypothetical protein